MPQVVQELTNAKRATSLADEAKRKLDAHAEDAKAAAKKLAELEAKATATSEELEEQGNLKRIVQAHTDLKTASTQAKAVKMGALAKAIDTTRRAAEAAYKVYVETKANVADLKGVVDVLKAGLVTTNTWTQKLMDDADANTKPISFLARLEQDGQEVEHFAAKQMRKAERELGWA